MPLSLFLTPPQIPLCRVIRFNIDYTIHFIEEKSPEVITCLLTSGRGHYCFFLVKVLT